jgi:putative ABC transport system permease protein
MTRLKNHFLLISIRHSAKHPIQSLLLVLGVALGVAMIVAIDLANSSAGQAFTLSTNSIVGKATHQIVATSDNLPSALYEDLRINLGLKEIAPVVTGLVLLPQAKNLPLQLLGVDPFAEFPFRSYLGNQESGLSMDALVALLVQPNTILLTRDLGQQYGWQPGDTLAVVTDGQTRVVTLVGLLEPADDLSRRALNGLMLADISTAQELLGQTGHLSHIDLILPPEYDPQPIVDRLPPNARLQAAALRNATVKQMTAAFELNLTALSLLALIVGIFLIYNTISFSVVQRRPVLGTLRCLGVTRAQIFGLVLTEALVLGAIGAAIGLGLGVALGRGLVGLVTRTINDLYFTLTVQSVAVSAFTLYKGLAAGLGASLLAAFIPALEATTAPPNAALKRSEQESRVQRLLPWLILAGGLLALAGWGLLLVRTRWLALNFAALFMILLGAALLTPWLTRLFMALLQPLTARALGIIGVMAPRDITRALSRTAVTIAALMLAVSVIIGVSVMIDSFRHTVITWLDNVLAADIYVSPAGQNLRVQGSIDPAFVEQVQRTQGVTFVSLLRSAGVFSPEAGQVELRAFSPQPNEQRRPLLWAAGSAADAFAALDAGGVMVSEVFARRNGLPLNAPSAITLVTDAGPRPFRVIGIFYDYAEPELGYVLLRLATYRAHWQDNGISNVGLFLDPAQARQADALALALQNRFAGQYTLAFDSNRGIKENALAVFDRTFTITAALRLLATIVAFIGVLSTLMSLQLERTRELGTLRANGMSAPQLWAKTFLETGLMGLTAGLIAMPVGLVLALILIYVINLRTFGWSLQLNLNPSIFGMALVVALTAALLAGIYPVLRLTKIEIAAALREE